ncbi:MAG: AI-2E family transporter [Gammaproteobacteria bacterium]
MLEVLKTWCRRYFSDPQAVILAFLLIAGFTIVLTMGNMLAPVLASIVIAYLLEGVVRYMEHFGCKRLLAVAVVTFLFVMFLFFLIFGMVPLLSIQITELIKELPNYLHKAQQVLLQLPQHYSFISEKQVLELSETINKEIALFGQNILALSLSSIPGLITLAVYLVLVPLLVFFFLKDKEMIIGWFSGKLPKDRALASEVWSEMDMQLGNYIRGKFWEILIVGIVTYLGFVVFGLKYAILLGVAVGLSVLIPYIGAAVVTIPVAVVAYFQFGWGSEFIALMVVYLVIQGLDGNLLVPLLFSEVVNLHPVAIIVSVLFFGGLWGFWGVFFAIPLATLVKALITSWPRSGVEK